MTLASFYRLVLLTNDEVTATLGGVTLQMVRDDIIHESTDAIINTTDFSNNQSGMIDGFSVLYVLIDFIYTRTGPQHLSLPNCVFTNSTGVSKAILTAAGPTVQAELAQGKP